MSKKGKKILILICTLSCLLLTFSIAFADAQHLFTGGYRAVTDLGYVLSGGDSSYQQNIMVAGANAWNGLSSNVAVGLNTDVSAMSIYYF
ncbi:hypothetical protein Psch_03635 [Pelotomaculum schinkii]|uniref:Uncharacterized protein n=1 Tax=Pelotomaculum schinkii TaxID=78350 RepID=A0A4Y7R854_9FIRM|nr:hypothetical protein [Pelotomaculum schinkii]TEB04873.1 hypothetical protein Psch_03635 [Pelotomaculum schinkii]